MYDVIAKAANTKDQNEMRGFLSDRNWRIRSALAMNPNLQEKHFVRLLDDNDDRVRSSALKNSRYGVQKEDIYQNQIKNLMNMVINAYRNGYRDGNNGGAQVGPIGNGTMICDLRKVWFKKG